MDLESLVQEMRHIREKLNAVAAAVIGDPADETKPGILIRLDRLERSYRNMMVYGGFLATMLATIITAYILRFV